MNVNLERTKEGRVAVGVCSTSVLSSLVLDLVSYLQTPTTVVSSPSFVVMFQVGVPIRRIHWTPTTSHYLVPWSHPHQAGGGGWRENHPHLREYVWWHQGPLILPFCAVKDRVCMEGEVIRVNMRCDERMCDEKMR